MPQLDPSTYTSQIFWLLICFFCLMFIMSKFIVPKISGIRQQRENKIDTYLRKAELVQQKTEAAIKRYEEALNDATKKANQSLQATREELDEMISQRQAELDKKLKKQLQQGETEIAKGKEEALKEIKSVSSEIAMEILTKLEINKIKPSELKTIINHEAE